MRIYLIALILLGLASCDQLKVPDQNVSYYYNIDSLVNYQKKVLSDKKASLEKWAYVDNDTSSSTYTPDTTQWRDELSFFNKMNINKPVLQGVYQKKVSKDENSNLTVTSYIPDQPQDVEIKYLKLYYYKSLNDLKKVEAEFEEKNPIYSSIRQFTLNFDKNSDELLLTKFEVKGGQKMILKDSIQFKIEATVQYP